MDPKTEYAHLGNDRIAYQVIGDGPVDLVSVHGMFSSIDVAWAHPEFAALNRRLSTFSRFIMFDRLGSGVSSAVSLEALPPLEARWAEVRAVMDAAGSERAVLLGRQDGGPPAMLGAATDPNRVAGLILFHSPRPVGAGRRLPDWDARRRRSTVARVDGCLGHRNDAQDGVPQPTGR